MTGPSGGGLGRVRASTGRIAMRVAIAIALRGMLAISGQRGIRRRYTRTRRIGRRRRLDAGDTARWV